MLDDIKIAELAMYLPLPYAGAFLAQMGAGVTKIENPRGGDPLKPLDESAYEALNRGKKTVYLDIKSPDDAAKIKEIILQSDIVLNGFRPGFLDKAGLGYKTLSADNPRLIYINLAGYDGGLSIGRQAGHDLNFVALSGIMHNLVKNREKAEPLPFMIADMSGAFWAVIGSLYMLRRRDRKSLGGELDLSLFRAALSFFPFFYFGTEGGLIDKGLFYGEFACYNVYQCSDGRHIAVGSVEDKFFSRLLDILGLEGASDQFEPGAQPALKAKVEKKFLEHDSAYWNDILRNEDICVGPVYTREELKEFLEKELGGPDQLGNFLLFPFQGEKTTA